MRRVENYFFVIGGIYENQPENFVHVSVYVRVIC
jgi:hypothetical protein